MDVFPDLEDFWDDLLVFNQMVLIFHSFKGFSDLEDFWDDLPVSRLKYNALDDLPVSRLDFLELLTKSSSISSGVQACLCRGMIYNSFVCEGSIRLCFAFEAREFDLHNELYGEIYRGKNALRHRMFFRYGFGYASFSDLKDFWDDLPVSRLKYNALDDFQEVFQTTSMKSSKKSSGLPGSLLTKPPFHNRSERFDGSHLPLIFSRRLTRKSSV
ncbi:hypothetical protein F2Q70_00035251 [Brassica cretica]|uniref:Uncharacterized protein n=1 Tax=Brassica cretica TaxID=69181 RepID=A0A8S9JRA6_BRACR|nr:hypothetical protein F2Q70_00035251 [Brassica cretica]